MGRYNTADSVVSTGASRSWKESGGMAVTWVWWLGPKRDPTAEPLFRGSLKLKVFWPYFCLYISCLLNEFYRVYMLRLVCGLFEFR